MAVQHSRHEVVARLEKQVVQGKPVIGVGAGTGISAKFAERGGADLIIIYNSGRYRMSGFGSLAGLLAYGDANAIVMEMGEREVLPVVKDVPVIAGVNGTDPTREMKRFVEQVKSAGFSGVNNFPTVGIIDGTFRQGLEETGMGYDKEVAMIEAAHDLDLFTCVYCFSAEEAKMMAHAGADVVIAHVGLTTGGTVGASTALTLDQAAEKVQEIIAAARSIRREIIGLSHGGPISSPDDAAYVNQHSDAVGFVGASSIERLAAETAIEALTAKFKAIPIS